MYVCSLVTTQKVRFLLQAQAQLMAWQVRWGVKLNTFWHAIVVIIYLLATDFDKCLNNFKFQNSLYEWAEGENSNLGNIQIHSEGFDSGFKHFSSFIEQFKITNFFTKQYTMEYFVNKFDYH